MISFLNPHNLNTICLHASKGTTYEEPLLRTLCKAKVKSDCFLAAIRKERMVEVDLDVILRYPSNDDTSFNVRDYIAAILEEVGFKVLVSHYSINIEW